MGGRYGPNGSLKEGRLIRNPQVPSWGVQGCKSDWPLGYTPQPPPTDYGEKHRAQTLENLVFSAGPGFIRPTQTFVFYEASGFMSRPPLRLCVLRRFRLRRKGWRQGHLRH